MIISREAIEACFCRVKAERVDGGEVVERLFAMTVLKVICVCVWSESMTVYRVVSEGGGEPYKVACLRY